MSVQQVAGLVPFSLTTMPQKEIQAQLQALKRRLTAALASKNSSSADQVLIGADMLLLLGKIKGTSYNNLLKRKALAFIHQCRAELYSIKSGFRVARA